MNIKTKQALMVYNPFSGKKGAHKEVPMLKKNYPKWDTN